MEETKIRISVLIPQLSRKTAETVSIKVREMESLLSARTGHRSKKPALGCSSVKSHGCKHHSERHLTLDADKETS